MQMNDGILAVLGGAAGYGADMRLFAVQIDSHSITRPIMQPCMMA